MATLRTLVFIGCLLLAWSGITKVFGNVPLSILESIFSSSGRVVLARVVGLAEMAVGLLVATFGARPAVAAYALLYASFAVFSAVSIRGRSKEAVPCGCFGRRNAQFSLTHVLIDATFALSAAPFVIYRPSRLGTVLGSARALRGYSVSYLLVLVASSVLLVASMIELPSLRGRKRYPSIDLRLSEAHQGTLLH